jgi:hypothetical protein
MLFADYNIMTSDNLCQMFLEHDSGYGAGAT